MATTNTAIHIEDSELGRILVRHNPRAKRLIFRAEGGRLTLTCHPKVPTSAMLEAIGRLRPRLHALLAKSTGPTPAAITPEAARELSALARRTLPPRLAELAAMHGLHYNKVRITGMRTRWGSCGASGNISLSAYITTLPPHLQDFVMLHELCHTRHMNHGPAFWEMLDKLTGGNCARCRSEMKARTIPPAASRGQEQPPAQSCTPHAPDAATADSGAERTAQGQGAPAAG